MHNFVLHCAITPKAYESLQTEKGWYFSLNAQKQKLLSHLAPARSCAYADVAMLQENHWSIRRRRSLSWVSAAGSFGSVFRTVKCFSLIFKVIGEANWIFVLFRNVLSVYWLFELASFAQIEDNNVVLVFTRYQRCGSPTRSPWKKFYGHTWVRYWKILSVSVLQVEFSVCYQLSYLLHAVARGRWD